MLSLVYASFRVVTIPATLFVIMFFRMEAFRCDIVGFMTHVVYDVTDSRVWLPLLVTCLFGLVTVMIAGVASKVKLFLPANPWGPNTTLPCSRGYERKCRP